MFVGKQRLCLLAARVNWVSNPGTQIITEQQSWRMGAMLSLDTCPFPSYPTQTGVIAGSGVD